MLGNGAQEVGGLDRRRVGQQREQARLERLVFGSQPGDPLRLLPDGQIEDVIEQMVESGPRFGVHLAAVIRGFYSSAATSAPREEAAAPFPSPGARCDR